MALIVAHNSRLQSVTSRKSPQRGLRAAAPHHIHNEEQREMNASMDMLRTQLTRSAHTQSRDQHRGTAPPTFRLNPPTSIKVTETIPTGQPDLGKPSLRLSSRVVLGRQVDHENQHTQNPGNNNPHLYPQHSCGKTRDRDRRIPEALRSASLEYTSGISKRDPDLNKVEGED